MVTFKNISERYGDNEVVTLQDYYDLAKSFGVENAKFEERGSKIVEVFEDGTEETVAREVEE